MRGVAYDVPILGYRNGTANLLRLWKAEATESFDFEAFNQGDYWGAVDQKVDSENITKVLYPNDELVRGKQAAPRAAVLLRVLLAPGHDPDLPAEGRRRPLPLPREVRGPAQRHAPRGGGGRADAAPRGRPRDGLGRGLGDHAAHVRLHEPHAAPRGAREVEGRDVRLRPAPPPRDRLRDQPPLPGRGPEALPGRRGPRRPPQPDRRGGRPLGADGPPRERGQPPHQRRGGAPHGAPEGRRAPRLPRAVAGEVRERHERGDAPALPRSREPAARRPRDRGDRRRLAEGPRAAPAASSRWPRTPRSGRSGAR